MPVATLVLTQSIDVPEGFDPDRIGNLAVNTMEPDRAIWDDLDLPHGAIGEPRAEVTIDGRQPRPEIKNPATVFGLTQINEFTAALTVLRGLEDDIMASNGEPISTRGTRIEEYVRARGLFVVEFQAAQRVHVTKRVGGDGE